MEPFIIIGIFAAIAWFWLDSLRSREISTEICRQICQKNEIQFLDGTVSLQSIRINRNQNGHLQFNRCYRFDYSDGSLNRYAGELNLIGKQLQTFNLENIAS